MSLKLGVSQGKGDVIAGSSRRRLQAERGGNWRGTREERLGGLEGEACHIKERMLLQIRFVPIVTRIKSSHSRKKFRSSIVPCRVISIYKHFGMSVMCLSTFLGKGKSASVKGSIPSVCILLPEEGLPGPESFRSLSIHKHLVSLERTHSTRPLSPEFLACTCQGLNTKAHQGIDHTFFIPSSKSRRNGFSHSFSFQTLFNISMRTN